MKIVRFLSIIALFCWLLPPSHSQNAQYGISLSPGLSQQFFSSSFTFQTMSSPFVLSGNGGLFYEQKFGNRSRVGLELLWVQLTGRMESKFTLTDINGQSLGGESVFRNDTYISYIGLPIYYQFNLGKWGIKAGIQSLFFLFASGKAISDFPEGFQVEDSEVKLDDLAFNFMDYGPRLGVNYQINPRWRIRSNFYLGMSNIFPRPVVSTLKNRQLDIGVDFSI